MCLFSVIIIIIFPFSLFYDVSFDIRCDDYIFILDGSSLLKDYNQWWDKNQWRSFSASFSLDNPISIKCLNDEGGFGLVGKVDLKYRKVSTNDLGLWTIGLPGETCYGVESVNYYDGNTLFLSIPNDGSHNYKSCTFQLSTNFCAENIYYFQIDNEKKYFEFTNVLKGEKSSKFDKMNVEFSFAYSLKAIIKTKFKNNKNDNIINSGDSISIKDNKFFI